MKSSLYCITDTKANRTTEPFSCPTDEVAKRNFLFGCFASDTPPQDCILWKIADFHVDEDDSSVFSLNALNGGFKVLNPSIEEIEAYHKIFLKMNPSEDFEEFQDKGVI